MISDTDFEKLWFMYQTDGAGRGISINTFCQQNGVPYNEFEKWYKKTHRTVERVEITGMPEELKPVSSSAVSSHKKKKPAPQSRGKISITILTRDGLQICKGGLDYPGLKLFVERLEGLC